MASEVVCGLVFRLLLPICLAVGECGVLTEVTKEDGGGPEVWDSVLRAGCAVCVAEASRYALSGV